MAKRKRASKRAEYPDTETLLNLTVESMDLAIGYGRLVPAHEHRPFLHMFLDRMAERLDFSPLAVTIGHAAVDMLMPEAPLENERPIKRKRAKR